MSGNRRTRAILILIAWAVVVSPLTWGIYNTALNVAKLFVRAPGAVIGIKR